jgi:hypothetical protein
MSSWTSAGAHREQAAKMLGKLREEMGITLSKGDAFQPDEVWQTPRGALYRVMGYEHKVGKPKQAVLRLGADGSGRKVLRDWDGVIGWTMVPALHITEGVSGTWFYHLSPMTTNATALCGARTMNTSMPLQSWGVRGHLNERWCADCAQKGAATLGAAGVAVVAEA